MTTKAVIPAFSATSYEFATYEDAQNWIGGEWKQASLKETMEVMNPRHGKAMAKVGMSGEADVADAVAAAKKALPEWSAMPIRERGEVLYKLRELVLRDLEELTWLVSHENGKTYDESKAERRRKKKERREERRKRKGKKGMERSQRKKLKNWMCRKAR